MNTDKTKIISPIKIINQKKNNNNSQLSEFDTNDVFNYDWTEVVSPKSHKRLNSDKQSQLSKTTKTTNNMQFTSHSKFIVTSYHFTRLHKKELEKEGFQAKNVKNALHKVSK